MFVNNNSIEQINVALNDIYTKINNLNINTSDIESIKTNIANIQRTLNETKNGLSSGATYNINIRGNASTATYATTSGSTTHAETADFATTSTDADHADTADSATTAETATTASTATNAEHATTADSATTAGSATTADSATTAETATKDSDGNTISTTYQKVSDMSDYQAVSGKNAVAGYVNCNQTTNGNYKLRATVSGGTVTYSWVADN